MEWPKGPPPPKKSKFMISPASFYKKKQKADKKPKQQSSESLKGDQQEENSPLRSGLVGPIGGSGFVEDSSIEASEVSVEAQVSPFSENYIIVEKGEYVLATDARRFREMKKSKNFPKFVQLVAFLRTASNTSEHWIVFCPVKEGEKASYDFNDFTLEGGIILKVEKKYDFIATEIQESEEGVQLRTGGNNIVGRVYCGEREVGTIIIKDLDDNGESEHQPDISMMEPILPRKSAIQAHSTQIEEETTELNLPDNCILAEAGFEVAKDEVEFNELKKSLPKEIRPMAFLKEENSRCLHAIVYQAIPQVQRHKIPPRCERISLGKGLSLFLTSDLIFVDEHSRFTRSHKHWVERVKALPCVGTVFINGGRRGTIYASAVVEDKFSPSSSSKATIGPSIPSSTPQNSSTCKNNQSSSSDSSDSPQSIVSLHEDTNREEFPMIDADVALNGAAPGNVAESVILESETESTMMFDEGAKWAYADSDISDAENERAANTRQMTYSDTSESPDENAHETTSPQSASYNAETEQSTESPENAHETTSLQSASYNADTEQSTLYPPDTSKSLENTQESSVVEPVDDLAHGEIDDSITGEPSPSTSYPAKINPKPPSNPGFCPENRFKQIRNLQGRANRLFPDMKIDVSSEYNQDQRKYIEKYNEEQELRIAHYHARKGTNRWQLESRLSQLREFKDKYAGLFPGRPYPDILLRELSSITSAHAAGHQGRRDDRTGSSRLSGFAGGARFARCRRDYFI